LVWTLMVVIWLALMAEKQNTLVCAVQWSGLSWANITALPLPANAAATQPPWIGGVNGAEVTGEVVRPGASPPPQPASETTKASRATAKNRLILDMIYPPGTQSSERWRVRAGRPPCRTEAQVFSERYRHKNLNQHLFSKKWQHLTLAYLRSNVKC